MNIWTVVPGDNTRIGFGTIMSLVNYVPYQLGLTLLRWMTFHTTLYSSAFSDQGRHISFLPSVASTGFLAKQHDPCPYMYSLSSKILATTMAFREADSHRLCHRTNVPVYRQMFSLGSPPYNLYPIQQNIEASRLPD